MATLTVVPTELETIPPAPALTLWNIEEALTSLIDTAELVPAEEEQAFAADLGTALLAAVEKRDRVGAFLSFCDSQIAREDAESKRHLKRKAAFERTVERTESYIARVIQAQGADAKGKYPKLAGTSVSFSLRKNPPTTAISDEAAVPAAYKSVSVSLPASLWEEILDTFEFEFRARVLDAVKHPDSSVSKTLVKGAIEAAVPNWKELLKTQPSVYTDSVPGAAIAAGGLKLVRE